LDKRKQLIIVVKKIQSYFYIGLVIKHQSINKNTPT